MSNKHRGRGFHSRSRHHITLEIHYVVSQFLIPRQRHCTAYPSLTIYFKKVYLNVIPTSSSSSTLSFQIVMHLNPLCKQCLISDDHTYVQSTNLPTTLAQTVMFLTCVWEVLCPNLVHDTNYSDIYLCYFPQTFQMDSRMTDSLGKVSSLCNMINFLHHSTLK